MQPSVLIVEDEVPLATATATYIERHGFISTVVTTLRDAEDNISRRMPDIILLDVVLPDGSGLDLLTKLEVKHTPRVVVVTAHPTLHIAVEALRRRVADFLVKPFDAETLLQCLMRIKRALYRQVEIVPTDNPYPVFEEFVGTSDVMLELYQTIDRVAPSEASVLVTGRSGTGKDLVAKAIHARSDRSEQPFVTLNCSAISSDQATRELFGWETDRQSGDPSIVPGCFERAHRGTLYLDGIAEMSMDQQVHLLRVLESGSLRRVGGTEDVMVDTRTVASTKRDLLRGVKDGTFREDLYFRLSVFPIHVPDLDDRLSDIPALARYFLNLINTEQQTDKRIEDETLARLEQRRWPGNVRQLRNVLQRAWLLADDELTIDHFDHNEVSHGATDSAEEDEISLQVGQTTLHDMEKAIIFATLKRFNGDKPSAAKTLGISLKTLYNKLKRYE